MFNWIYGENKSQKYYDTFVNGKYLCVFQNKWQPEIWMGMIGNHMIENKTRNDRQRKKQGLPRGCKSYLLKRNCMLCSPSPEYMMRKVERCYKGNKTEICE